MVLLFRWNEWLTLPINYSTLPLTSQLAITIWDLSPTGGEGAKGHAVPFGGTTLPLFDKENTLQKGRQKCYIHRHKAADGLASTSTPSSLPPVRRSNKNGVDHEVLVDKEGEELDRLEKLFKKHEMGEIPRIDWLDQLVFRGTEKRGLQASNSALRTLQRNRSKSHGTVMTLAGAGNDVSKTPGQMEMPKLTRSKTKGSPFMSSSRDLTFQSYFLIMNIHHLRFPRCNIYHRPNRISYSSPRQKSNLARESTEWMKGVMEDSEAV